MARHEEQCNGRHRAIEVRLGGIESSTTALRSDLVTAAEGVKTALVAKDRVTAMWTGAWRIALIVVVVLSGSIKDGGVVEKLLSWIK